MMWTQNTTHCHKHCNSEYRITQQQTASFQLTLHIQLKMQHLVLKWLHCGHWLRSPSNNANGPMGLQANVGSRACQRSGPKIEWAVSGRGKKLTRAGGSRNGNRAVSRLNWPLKLCSMVMLLNLRYAVQSAKSVLPDAKYKLSICIQKSDYKFTIFFTDYIYWNRRVWAPLLIHFQLKLTYSDITRIGAGVKNIDWTGAEQYRIFAHIPRIRV